ncbi:MAG: hypothetical protein PVG12_02610, partial [Gammaproteobacteria bacterium]
SIDPGTGVLIRVVHTKPRRQKTSALLQGARSSSSPIPCQHQFSFHGIVVFCLARRNKYHEKHH